MIAFVYDHASHSTAQSAPVGARTMAIGIVLDGHLVMTGQLLVTMQDDQGGVYNQLQVPVETECGNGGSLKLLT